MEKGCILPDNLIHELSKEGNIVLYSLARFCKSTEKELLDVLKMRNKYPEPNQGPRDKETKVYGYNRYRKQMGKKKRLLSVPNESLKKIQEIIMNRLANVPTSLASTAGKQGDSPEKNAEMHRYNQYLIVMDIKNAYPSINTHRVYTSLQGALTKPLETRCPLLENDDQKDLFVRSITHLCVCEDELPQGASTSSQIQNIVMRKVDIRIEKKLPELSGSKMVYSRYADDMAISFPHFSTYEVLEEKMNAYEKALDPNKKKELTAEEVASTMEKFSQETFILTDKLDLKLLQKKIDAIKSHIQQCMDRGILSEEEKYTYIGIIDTYKKHIKRSGRRMRDITDKILDILGDEGWKVNIKKINTRTPQSDRDREINGMTFDHTGKRGIDKKKRSQYLRLLSDLLNISLDDMEESKYKYYSYKFKFKHRDDKNQRIESILGTIKGIYNYIASIYGKDDIPRELSEACQAAKAKWENYDERKKHRKVPEDQILKSKLPRDEDNDIHDLYNKQPDNERDDLPF